MINFIKRHPLFFSWVMVISILVSFVGVSIYFSHIIVYGQIVDVLPNNNGFGLNVEGRVIWLQFASGTKIIKGDGDVRGWNGSYCLLEYFALYGLTSPNFYGYLVSAKVYE